MSILLKNARAYTGETLQLLDCDILIDNDGIVKIIENGKEQLTDDLNKDFKVLNVEGMLILPGFSDLHVHFREPGFENKETIKSGQKAAIAGGVTQVCTMPNTMPAMDRVERLENYLSKVREYPYIEVLPSVAVTLDQLGIDITDLQALTDNGAVAYTDDGRTVMDPMVLAAALKVSQKTNCPVMTHSEDHDIAALYPEGPYPPEVESDIVARDIDILKEIGGHLHIAHLSTIDSLEAVKRGKANGLNVTCEVSPHHLYFNADELDFSSAFYKVNPPLRGEINRKGLIQGIKDGIIDAIASDHAPHEWRSKLADYKDGSYGFTGLETMFSAVYTVFKSEQISMETLIQMMCINPRKILGRAPNYIQNDKYADLICIDPNQKWQVNEENFQSKSKNSPWIGHQLEGKVVHVIKGNHLLLEGGQLNVI